MAKARKARKARKSTRKMARKSMARAGTTVGSHKFGGKSFSCYGKRVKVRGGGRTARIFCRAAKKAA